MPIKGFDKWPASDSEFLNAIVESIRSRSKSLRSRTDGLFIEIVPDYNDPQLTRLNLGMRNWSPNPHRMSITFWDDGAMWLDARRASKSGWEYEFSLTGCCHTIDPDHIREMIEDSLWIECPDKMREVWSVCELRLG